MKFVIVRTCGSCFAGSKTELLIARFQQQKDILFSLKMMEIDIRDKQAD